MKTLGFILIIWGLLGFGYGTRLSMKKKAYRRMLLRVRKKVAATQPV
jgi:hypothetical protein